MAIMFMMMVVAFLIFVIFSTDIFWLTQKQKRVNRNKTDRATTQRKSQQTAYILCDLRHSPQHTHDGCGELPHFYTFVMWRNLNFLQMTDVEKFQISPHLLCEEI